MVEISGIKGIKDRDSLRAWLKTQPQQTSVAIAHRAAKAHKDSASAGN